MNILTYQAVLFDFDGTLVDSMSLWHQIDEIFLGQRGITCPPDLSYAIAGMSFPETAAYFKERFHLSEDIDTIQTIWINMSYDLYLSDIAFKPGARELVRALADRGMPMGIATSNSRRTLTAYLAQYGLLDAFSALCFTNEVGVGKPDPAVFLEAARIIGVPPETCLLFEDTLEGVQGGKAAGMDVIAVQDLWQGEHLARIKALADGFITGFTDLIPRKETP